MPPSPQRSPASDRAIDQPGPIESELGELRGLLLAHLEHEETSVLPLIEQRLTHGQWRQWLLLERSRRSRGEQLAFIDWVLDSASPTDASAVLREFPPIGRLVYTRLVAPVY